MPRRIPLAVITTPQPADDITDTADTAAAERVVIRGQVVAIPSPDGIVRVVGVGAGGEWLGEFSCRAVDLEDKHIRNMELFVAEKTGVARLALVKTVAGCVTG